MIALFVVVATFGVGAPVAFSVAFPGSAHPLLEMWRLRLTQYSHTIVSCVLLGAGALLWISALSTLLG
jgi:hypothetical protein